MIGQSFFITRKAHGSFKYIKSRAWVIGFFQKPLGC